MQSVLPLSIAVRQEHATRVCHHSPTRTCIVERMPRSNAYIGLGSNLGDRDRNIARAVQLLDTNPDIHIVQTAPIVESEALVQPDTPDQPPYRNTVAHLRTTLEPQSLMAIMLETENTMGRVRTIGNRWESRTIDLDLLLYDDLVYNTPGLTIPHPHMHTRTFVLEPLAQLDPNLSHPVLKQTVKQLLATCRQCVSAIIVLLGVILSTPLQAQQPTAAQILSAAHQSLHANPYAATVELQLRSDEGLQTQIISIYSQNASTIIDLGLLHILVTADACTIQHTQSNRYITLRDDQRTGWQLLASALPTIPIFLLDLLAADDPASIQYAALGQINWAPPTKNRKITTLEGAGELNATITLTLNTKTAAIIQATTRLTTTQGTRTILQQYNPTPIESPVQFAKRIARLNAGKRVESISQLIPTQGTTHVGDHFPFMLLLFPDGRADITPPSTPTVWIFSRHNLNATLSSTLQTLLETESFSTRFVSIHQSTNPIDTLNAIDEQFAPAIRWSADPATTIDQFAPDANAVLVLTDADQQVLLIHTLEGDQIDTKSLLGRIAKLLP
jgi:2-amino-4-hydroxy-6-hydroxymethyldihydropteridine diphosphokinase